MSFEALTYAQELRLAPNGESLTSAEKLVLFYLAHAHNAKEGLAWPSQPTIAADCGLSVRHVQKILKSLERKGVIRVIHPERNGRGRFLCYLFPVLEGRERDSREGAADSGKAHERRTVHPRNTQETRTIDAQRATAIKEELRTKNTGTEQQHNGSRIPDGLDQNRGKQVWSAIREHLEAHVDPHAFETWLKPLTAIGCADSELWIRLPHPEFKEMAERYRDLVEQALTSKKIHDIRTVRFACTAASNSGPQTASRGVAV
jgi:Helix-turn-helix domain/DnaA N-terminal domain